jgi:Helix-hairpin-helix motif
MKKQFISFFTYTRNERTGIIALLVVLCLLTGIRIALPYLAKPKHDTQKEAELAAEWAQYHKRTNSVQDSTAPIKKNRYQTKEYSGIVDLNTANKKMLQKLKGIGPQAAEAILRRRRLHGDFTDPRQIVQYCKVPEYTYKKIANQLVARPIQKHAAPVTE